MAEHAHGFVPRTDHGHVRNVKDTDYIETFTGKCLYFMDPRPEDFDILDIAHALSNNCRWTGHCRFFASVAEHSVAVSSLLRGEDRLAGLLHDASEAYLTDVASPIKPYLQNYRSIEDKLMHAIAERFGFRYPLNDAVKAADVQQLSTEAHTLIPSGGDPWDWAHWTPSGKRPPVGRGVMPVGYPPKLAEDKFLKCFFGLATGLT